MRVRKIFAIIFSGIFLIGLIKTSVLIVNSEKTVAFTEKTIVCKFN